ncbi:MAG: redox-active protein [Verrucomicrobiota bacterium]
MKTHALAVFHRPPENLNCAQAVFAAYQAVSGDHSLTVASFKPWGGGRAPGGRCGALHAACTLAPASAGKINDAFLTRIGALCCREITQPCVDCVGTAAALLEQAASSAGK